MFISVVIPTYNRLPILRQCLQALEHAVRTGGTADMPHPHAIAWASVDRVIGRHHHAHPAQRRHTQKCVHRVVDDPSTGKPFVLFGA
jgi:hypothetical protein